MQIYVLTVHWNYVDGVIVLFVSLEDWTMDPFTQVCLGAEILTVK